MKAVNRELPYFFSDLNFKLIYRPTLKDELKFSHYSGDDVLDIFRDGNNDGDGFITKFKATNNSQSLQWSRQNISREKDPDPNQSEVP